MTTSPSPRARGALVAGRYAIQKKLGSGSTGSVYLARDGQNGRLLALKIISTERLMSGAADRMQEEFRALASLRHPQIAAAHDFGYIEEGGFPFYTREYVPGEPLPGGPPRREPPRSFLRPILDLLDALNYLHDHGILHLDIHAGNLIVADDAERGGVLIDFGLIRSLGESHFAVSSALRPAMPPELAGRGRASAQSDIFLAGRLLLYRLTGRSEGEARLPREIPGWGPRVTLDLERIAAKALQVPPEGRFASAAEFRDALSRALGESAAGPRRAAPPRELFVGREKELGAVEEAFREAAAGRPAALWFTGRRGLGKSRLLEEARLAAQLRGLDVVDVSFPSDPAAAPALAAVLGSRLAGRRGSSRWLEPLRPEHGGSPAERAQRAAEAYFLEPGKPLVLLLDDVDFADKEGRSLVQAFFEECRRRRDGQLGGRGLALFAASAGAPPRGVPGKSVAVLKGLSAANARDLLRVLLLPLSPPRGLVRRAVEEAEGSPRSLRWLAASLRAEWGERGVLPATAELPRPAPSLTPAAAVRLEEASPLDRQVLQALAVVRRSARAEELACALGLAPPRVLRALRRLEGAEAVRGHGRGPARRFELPGGEGSSELLAGVSPLQARAMHLRLVAHLRRKARPEPRDLESLARHLLAAGERERGLVAVREAAARLGVAGSFERALSLLEDAARGEEAPRRRLELAEAISAIAEATGDHLKGIEALEPFLRASREELSPRKAVRVRRRLGVHYHRSGRLDEAMGLLDEAERLADPRRDVEDLVFIDSELAELHIFRGAYPEAERACRRGLERADRLPAGDAFRCRMEVVLRASLGHLKLRQLELPRARSELRAAVKLARRHGTTAEQAAILNNLGIAENQLSRFGPARGCFRRAERLLLRAGERRNVIQIATNLAVIAAKMGEREEARLQVERASQMVRHFPDRRLEFVVAYTRGLVAHAFGEAGAAAECLEAALPLGRKLGDDHLAAFGEVYLAEAHLAAGRYSRARESLLALAARAEREGPPLLQRMVHSRLFLTLTILDRGRLAARSWRTLRETPRTSVELLEAWNDLFAGLGLWFAGESASGVLGAALQVFTRLKVLAGEGLARLALLTEAISGGKADPIRVRLGGLKTGAAEGHRFLAAAEPLARAEASFVLGELELAEQALAKATNAIVGSPFLELDWRIEFLRSRLAARRGDIKEGRRHLHRALHTRDLLVELVPRGARARFLAHPRFAPLAGLGARWEKSPRLHFRTDELRRAREYEGMVGQTSPMVRLFRAIEGLRDHDLTVLVRGETGTGKELVARAVHRRSARQGGPFLALHCAALPAELFEAELFGHEAGAFTGAEEDRAGILEAVDGGTLLLDEIGQLAPAAQAKLLQFLDSRTFRRVGAREARRADVRLIASTSTDLGAAARAGAFRPDLFYRLGAVELEVPPLRARRDDIPELARVLLRRHAERLDRPVPALRSDALALLGRHDWPGNVRELEAALLRALLNLSQPEAIGEREIEPFLAPRAAPLFDAGLLESRSLGELKRELEREYLIRLFRKAGGEPRRLMEALGVKRTQLYAWFRRLGIDVRKLRGELR